MVLTDLFQEYRDRMADITVAYRKVKKKTESDYEKLNEQKTNREKYPAQFKDLPFSADNLYFTEADSGQKLSYNHQRHSIDDAIQALIYHKNKQYQWFLAEAYEVFEDLIQKIYAYVGFKDNDIWPLSDYGGIRFSELPQKDFAWFLERAEKKELKGILCYLSNIYPAIKVIETNNHFKTNLFFSVLRTKYFRHLIVHNGGKTKDVALITEKIFKEAGLYNNGKYDADLEKQVTNYFGTGNYTGLIVLLEVLVPLQSDIPIQSHYDLVEGIFFNQMISYGHHIVKNLMFLDKGSVSSV